MYMYIRLEVAAAALPHHVALFPMLYKMSQYHYTSSSISSISSSKLYKVSLY